MSDKDASHIKSHNRGGSSNSDNLKWENKSTNRARNEQAVIEALQRLAKQRTTFLVTHDLTLANQADVIVYLEKALQGLNFS
ncbi:MAG: hypothetical protein ACFCU7_15855 [Pleurocapsa sp.]